MTLETAFDLPFWFEFAATVTGGLSGGMSARARRYDIFGTVAIACITGMGGGIIRDILLQNYGLYAFQSPWFLLSCALAPAWQCSTSASWPPTWTPSSTSWTTSR